mgnify:CR=1 FL=1
MSKERIDYNSDYKYTAVSPDERNIIINNINIILIHVTIIKNKWYM